ncbi:uracil-DNA glycosylase [Halocatena pleomorpha]|uniref:Type-4 uracil-DNA glycosylase n=1 Tax=Halocatena pleomorpha TaxID=1785090 RepID=A0A3P3RJR3_9EURY|nr:uracil-DNA glycosylase [Halocatena pleomorpha]RRJ33777.1 uracil-DNA glycosylase [Halocatena pleomorpha]
MTIESDFDTEFDEALTNVPEDQYDRSRFVPGSGSLDAEIVLVGEAPGEQEVKQNEPFVGPAGTRLRSLFEDVGLDRVEPYITNLVKVRPPENRNPRREEIDAWKPLLDAELERVDPTVVVPLGTFASRELLDTDRTISALRGQAYERNSRLVVPTYHPAASFYDDSTLDALAEDLRLAAENVQSERTS